MKIVALPKELPAPDFTLDFTAYDQAVKEHSEKLKAYLIKLGYTGKHTGKIYREGYADGHAQYMLADGPKSLLVHLPYGDGWNAPNVRFIPKKEIIKRIKADEEFAKLFT